MTDEQPGPLENPPLRRPLQPLPLLVNSNPEVRLQTVSGYSIDPLGQMPGDQAALIKHYHSLMATTAQIL